MPDRPRSRVDGVRRLFAELRDYVPGRRRYVILIATAVLGSFTEAGSLLLLTLAAASVATGDRQHEVLGVTIARPVMIAGAAVLLATRLLFVWLNNRDTVAMATDAVLEARSRVLQAFVGATYERQAAQSPAVLQDYFAGRCESVGASAALVSGVATALVNLTVLIVVAVVLQPLAVLGLTVVVAVLSLALRPLNAHVRVLAHENLEANAELVHRLGDLSSNVRDITSFGVGGAVVDGLEPYQARYARSFRRLRAFSGFLPNVYQTIGLGLAVAGLAVAAAIGQKNVAVLGAVVLLLLRCVSYGQQLLTASQAAAERLPVVLSVREIVEDFRAHRRPVGQLRPTTVDRIDLKDIGYRYGDGPVVLRRLNLSIAPGEMVGVVGPSGSGKSTLLQLLVGLRSPTEGELAVGGVPHQEIDPDWWSRRVALVPQDSKLILATLARNVAFYRKLDDEAIQSAVDEAQLSKDLDRIGGLDRELSPQGRSLSGGQIQRLAIARALAGAPELLVLDEPTSALDVGTEERLQQVLDDLHGKVTMVIVAHRLSTVATCDRIVVLEAGRIVADGPPAEVLKEFGRTAATGWELVGGTTASAALDPS